MRMIVQTKGTALAPVNRCGVRFEVISAADVWVVLALWNGVPLNGSVNNRLQKKLNDEDCGVKVVCAARQQLT